MPPTSVEKMLETMMMQILQPAQNPASAICCNCLKFKETTCKCLKNHKPKRKRCHRKRKSCLKTIVCVSKIAKDRGECQRCLCDPCCSNRGEDESFCPKCGQQLPGFVDEPLNKPEQYLQELVSCQQQLEGCQKGYNDMGVQVNVPAQQPDDMGVQVNVPAQQPQQPAQQPQQPAQQPQQPAQLADQNNQQLESCKQLLEQCQQDFNDLRGRANIERKEPLSVHIKVCPCPNTNPLRKEAKRVYHSVSVPELSSTNPRLVEEGTSENVVRTRYPHSGLEEDHYDTSYKSLPRMDRVNEITPEYDIDIASIKRLAMKMAMAQLVEEETCRGRERFRQNLERSLQKEIEEDSSENQSSPNTGRGPGVPRHLWFEDEEVETTSGPLGHRTRMSMPSSYLGQNHTQGRARSRGYLLHSEQEDIDEEGYHSSPEVPRHSRQWFEDEQVEITSGPLGHESQISRPSSYVTQNHTNCNQIGHTSRCNEYPNSPITGASYYLGQNMTAGCCCCSYTNAYRYDTEDGHYSSGYQWEHACTSGNSQFQPYRPFPGPCS